MIKKLIFWSKPIRYRLDRLTYKSLADRKPIQKLKNCLKDCPMLVVGNGPSLNKTPLDEFVDIPSIGTNKVDLIFSKFKWRPYLIICINNLVIKQNWENFVRSEIPVYLSWKGRWFAGSTHRNKVNYFLSLPTRDFSDNLVKGVGSAGTVTYAALQFAYYMGCNPVIIVGVDHSYNFSGEPNEIAKRKGPDQNHFDPNYFREGSTWGLPNLELSEIGYQYAKEAFENDGRTIYDATIGGKLDIFPKINIDEAIKICRNKL